MARKENEGCITVLTDLQQLEQVRIITTVARAIEKLAISDAELVKLFRLEPSYGHKLLYEGRQRWASVCEIVSDGAADFMRTLCYECGAKYRCEHKRGCIFRGKPEESGTRPPRVAKRHTGMAPQK